MADAPAATEEKKPRNWKLIIIVSVVAIVLLLIIIIALILYWISGKDKDSLEKDCLKSHNGFRKLHGIPELVLNTSISKYCTQWAKVNADLKRMHHRSPNQFGENIFVFMSPDVRCDVAVKSWYDEVKEYNFDEPKYLPASGHFTQVIWKNSKELGCGARRDSKGTTYLVCNYSPPGNINTPDQFKENVLKKKGDVDTKQNMMLKKRRRNKKEKKYYFKTNVTIK